MLARSILGLHPHDEIKELLALDHLRGRLASHCSLDHALDIGDIDAVACNLFAVHVNLNAGLPEFPDHRELAESRYLLQNALDLDCLIFQHLQVGPEDFYRQSALQSGQCLVDGILSRLREVENHSGILLNLFLNNFRQLGFIANRPFAPRRIFVGLQPDIKLTIEESGRVGAVVGTGQFQPTSVTMG